MEVLEPIPRFYAAHSGRSTAIFPRIGDLPVRASGIDTRMLYLVRHGATEANLQSPYRLQGARVDLPLCELGRRQAEAACRQLQQCTILRAFSSPLRRARETAEIIAAPHGCAVETVPEFVECDVGLWEGLSWEEIRARDPERVAAFLADPAAVSYPEGESFGDVARRVLPAVERLLAQDADGDTLIVWHSAVGQVYLGELLGLQASAARGLRLDNGGISLVENGPARPALVSLNSIQHLPQLLL